MALRPASSRALHVAVRKCKNASTWGLKRFASSESQQPAYQECDIVIVGGGPAGLALASALGSSKVVRDSIRVTLIEASDLTKVRQWVPPPGTFSNRVSSLTNASHSFLNEIGAWNHVEASRTCPIEEMQVWDGVSDARINFSASELASNSDGPPEMARLTENLNLQRALLRSLDTVPDVQILDKTKVTTIERGGGGGWPLIYLDNGKLLRARLLVGADGFNSPVRSYARISSYGWSYDTQAIVATMTHPPRGAFQGPNTTAYQRFLPTGPIAFLPLSPTVSSLVWSTQPLLASALLAAEPGVLISMINAAFRLPEVSLRYLRALILDGQKMGTPMTSAQINEEISWREHSHAIDNHSAYASASVSTIQSGVGVPLADSDLLPPLVTSLQVGTTASFPLRFNHAESYVGQGPGCRTVLIGDAAHTVHPLAGQGLNMGLADVESLARCIHKAVLDGGDIGSYTALLPYSQERYFENHKIMAAVDKLHKLYSTSSGPVVWARSVGLEVLNEFDSVKAAIMMSAGAGASSSRGTSGWNMAAAGVEGLASSSQAVKLLGEGFAGIAAGSLQRLLKTSIDQRN